MTPLAWRNSLALQQPQIDPALAQHLAAVGFDPAAGRCREAVGAEGEATTGCGGSCG